MSSLDILKSLYKPYRYTINNSVTIVESTTGKYVIKKQKKDLYSLFSYLENRGFNNFPKIIHNFREEENVFEYIEEDYVPDEQKLLDLADILSDLHNKTYYYKNTTIDTYKEIRENLLSNIKYLKNHFYHLFLNILKEEFHSPSKYLFMRNYYKINECLNFCESETESWYELVKSSDKERVAVVNNNIKLEHFRENASKEVLLSWDNYLIDTPILDFVNFYKKEYLKYDFENFLTKYLNNFEISESEKKLLFILINIPNYFTFDIDDEFSQTKEIRKNIDYIYKSEKLTRPYYFKDETK